MDVKTILANIKSQALVGNTGAADDNDRLMRYINKAHTSIYGEIASINPALFQKRQLVTMTAGEGTFDTPVFRVLAVVDTENGNKRLEPRSTDDIEEEDALADKEGAPDSYEQTFNGLTSHPRNDTVLSVRFVPNATVLTEDTGEAGILIPVMYHETLEWATLWTIAYDERDKLVGSELQFTQSAYEKQMEKLRQYVISTLPKDRKRVKSW